MAKEGNEEGGNTQEPTPRSPSELTAALLKQCIKSASGLTMRIASEDEPVTIVGGEVSDVKDGQAWIMFKVDNCCLRTDTLHDREKLLAWMAEGGTKPFSNERGCTDLIGPPGVTFVKVYGTLPKRPELKREVVSPTHFRSRAYANAGVRVEASRY